MRNYNISAKLYFLLLVNMLANAEDISVSGKVTASACVLDTANSDLIVNIGDFQESNLTSAGSVGGEKAFYLILKDCYPGTTSVNVKFTGTPYSEDNKAYANEGSAKNIGLQIKLYSEKWVELSTYPGGSATKSVDSATHSASFKMSVRPYTKTGGVTAGGINTTLNVTFSYQ